MSEQNITIQAFTELAPTYEKTVDRELRQFWGVGYQTFIARFIEMVQLNEDDTVLDVASGTGPVLRKLSTKLGANGRVFGLDITLAMLQDARKITESLETPAPIHTICGSGMEMPIADDVFDVITCCLGTHHMDAPRMLAEMKRVLKPGGRLLLADVRATTFWRSTFGSLALRFLLILYGLSLRSARAQAEMEAFNNVRTAHEWRVLLGDFGFEEIELDEIPALRRWYPGGFILKATSD